MKRDLKYSRFVYNGKASNIDDDFGTYWGRSKRENKPIYLLRYVSTKNNQKRYSEEGLDLLRKKYPELSYKNQIK